MHSGRADALTPRERKDTDKVLQNMLRDKPITSYERQPRTEEARLARMAELEAELARLKSMPPIDGAAAKM